MSDKSWGNEKQTDRVFINSTCILRVTITLCMHASIQCKLSLNFAVFLQNKVSLNKILRLLFVQLMYLSFSLVNTEPDNPVVYCTAENIAG